MQLHGIHHLTAVTARAGANHDFYTRVLGMRLVKRTVNQDDVSAYHLFYADGIASPGSDLTFFDWPVGPERRGTNSITRTALRVTDAAALHWWAARFDELGLAHGPVTDADGRAELPFEDPEGQRLALVADGGQGPAHPWDRLDGAGGATDPRPRPDHRQRAAAGRDGAVSARRSRHDPHTWARRRRRGDPRVQHGRGGPAAELHVRVEPSLRPAQPGAGSVHHVALRIPDDAYDGWVAHYQRLGVRSSGPVDRFYFRSLYTREPGGILIELATDGPGFATDEPLETAGRATRAAAVPGTETGRDRARAEAAMSAFGTTTGGIGRHAARPLLAPGRRPVRRHRR